MYKIILLIFLLIPLLGGCARNVDGTWKAPLVYRIDVQQGNVVDQEMVDKLKPGMDKNQVKFVMGTPLIKDTFHSNRWDYVYIMEPGRGERTQRRITLYFENEKLAYIDGDIKVGVRKDFEELKQKDQTVTVPLDYHEEGFFSRLIKKDKEEEQQPSDENIPEDEAITEQANIPEETSDTETEITSQEAIPSAKNESKTDVEETSETADKETIADKQQDKNLVRRFWDRMTTGAEDSGVAEGEEESERDLRDAEMLEKAGGEL